MLFNMSAPSSDSAVLPYKHLLTSTSTAMNASRNTVSWLLSPLLYRLYRRLLPPSQTLARSSRHPLLPIMRVACGSRPTGAHSHSRDIYRRWLRHISWKLDLVLQQRRQSKASTPEPESIEKKGQVDRAGRIRPTAFEPSNQPVGHTDLKVPPFVNLSAVYRGNMSMTITFRTR